MVFFTCNACGESLKKAQVEKHYTQKCRMCNVLSCVDCQKDFWGDEYKTHTKCITEDEKYSGKNYKPKPGANKGEQKQLEWTEQVQEAVDKVSADPKLRKLLESLIDYPNIPRKKAKFENFLKNSLRVWDGGLASRAWDAISAELNKKPQNGAVSTANGATETGQKQDVLTAEPKGKENGCVDVKEKKRKAETESSPEPEKKKKKKKIDFDDGPIEQPGSGEEAVRYSISASIVEILDKNEKKSMSMKKLRKKVMKRFRASESGEAISEEKLLKRFDKKLSKNPRLKIIENKVSLSPL